MEGVSDIERLVEGVGVEAKRARGGLPRSVWETYSAFANTDGGVILLGVSEDAAHRLAVTGVDDAGRMVRDFWNTVNDRGKVSANILSDADVAVRHTGAGDVVAITVPAARLYDRPVYVGPDPFSGSYRRNGDGDYRCDREEVVAMMRDSSLLPLDRQIVSRAGLDALSAESVAGYRKRFADMRPGHPWLRLGDEDFLLRVEAIGRDDADHVLRPTRAGLLFFGCEYEITREFPYYFLDYRECSSSGSRWDDRVVSSDGTWSGNLYDFWGIVIGRLRGAVAHPFRLGGDMRRIDVNPMDAAVREALTNTLVHADYAVRRGTVIVRGPDRVEFSNPGGLRLSVDEVVHGGVSDTRNPTLMKMFGLIGAGEKAGSGFDVMRQGCDFAGVPYPELAVSRDPDRVSLVLRTRRADGIPATAPGRWASDASAADAVGGNGLTGQERTIMRLLAEHGAVSSSMVAAELGVGGTRARTLLRTLEQRGLVAGEGKGRAHRYRMVR